MTKKATPASPATTARQPMTAEQLKAMDWGALITKLGPVFTMLITQLIAMFDKPQVMQSAKPTACPADVHCCCHEALELQLQAAAILAYCCCCDPEPTPEPTPQP